MISASKSDSAQKFYTSTGSERDTTSPEWLAKFQALEKNKWGAIIQEAKIEKE